MRSTSARRAGMSLALQSPVASPAGTGSGAREAKIAAVAQVPAGGSRSRAAAVDEVGGAGSDAAVTARMRRRGSSPSQSRGSHAPRSLWARKVGSAWREAAKPSPMPDTLLWPKIAKHATAEVRGARRRGCAAMAHEGLREGDAGGLTEGPERGSVVPIRARGVGAGGRGIDAREGRRMWARCAPRVDERDEVGRDLGHERVVVDPACGASGGGRGPPSGHHEALDVRVASAKACEPASGWLFEDTPAVVQSQAAATRAASAPSQRLAGRARLVSFDGVEARRTACSTAVACAGAGTATCCAAERSRAGSSWPGRCHAQRRCEPRLLLQASTAAPAGSARAPHDLLARPGISSCAEVAASSGRAGASTGRPTHQPRPVAACSASSP